MCVKFRRFSWDGACSGKWGWNRGRSLTGRLRRVCRSLRLSRHPDFCAGTDLAHVLVEAAALAASSSDFEGRPILAGEILSPTDMQAAIDE